MMWNCTPTLGIFCALCGFFMMPARLPAAEETAELGVDAIVARLRQRDQQGRSAEFHWTENGFAAKGSSYQPPPGGAEPPLDKPLPPDDQHNLQPRTFIFDGEKTYYESVDTVVNQSGDKVLLSRISTYDGSQRRILDAPSPDRPFPSGRIYRVGDPNFDLNLLHLEPILQVYRFGKREIPPAGPREFRVLPDAEMIGERKCVCLQAPGRNGGQRSYWFDVGKNFTLVRFTLGDSQQRVSRQTDFEYAEDRGECPVLSGWKIIKFRHDGAATLTIDARVTKARLNPELPESQFTIEFPPGAFIDDLRKQPNRVQKRSGEPL